MASWAASLRVITNRAVMKTWVVMFWILTPGSLLLFWLVLGNDNHIHHLGLISQALTLIVPSLYCHALPPGRVLAFIREYHCQNDFETTSATVLPADALHTHKDTLVLLSPFTNRSKAP